MADCNQVVVRFSRRELALVAEAVEFMALPRDPDDQRLVLELREVLTGAVGRPTFVKGEAGR